MTTHVVQVSPQSAAQPSGLRPIDVRRDLGEVADLIGDAFADELDQGGLSALREMRTLGQMGPFTQFLSRVSTDFYDMLGGFVWIEDGHVIGNITVQRVDTYGQRWAIANVAVAPPFRGRGISRKLMSAALEYIEGRSGKWAVLQVRENNPIARGLYDRMGFETLGGTGEYCLDRMPAQLNDSALPLRPLHNHEWHAAYELAVANTPSLMQWWQPVRADDFQMVLERRLQEAFLRLVGHSRVLRLALPATEGGRPLDAVTIVRATRWQGHHTLSLYVHPERHGALEVMLVDSALQTLQHYPIFPVATKVQATHAQAVAALRSAGFREIKTLLTMRKRL